MPESCCVPMCCKTGYRVDENGNKITFHRLPRDPSRLRVCFEHQYGAIKVELTITMACCFCGHCFVFVRTFNFQNPKWGVLTAIKDLSIWRAAKEREGRVNKSIQTFCHVSFRRTEPKYRFIFSEKIRITF